MKKIIIGLVSAGAVMIAAVIAFVYIINSDSDSYREIKIYKVDGSTNVERTGNIKMDAYENMQLQNEDYVNVLAESYTQLKMDEDKYALIEPESRISIKATGDDVDSKTTINLEYGSIVSHLEHKLSKKSSYEVNTPNSTMAVRGTSFRVNTYFDEDDVSFTLLEVIEGVVEVCLVYPDGSKSESKLIYSGKKILIRGDSLTSEYVYDDERVELEEYTLPVLDFLKIHFNEEYYCKEDDINSIMAVKSSNVSETAEPDNESEDGNVVDGKSDDEADDEVDDESDDEADDEVDNESDDESGDETNDEADDEPENVNPKNEEASETEYTVTFIYGEQIFATQTVKAGKKVNMPSLQPAPAGRWDYNFDDDVEGDITIYWVE